MAQLVLQYGTMTIAVKVLGFSRSYEVEAESHHVRINCSNFNLI